MRRDPAAYGDFRMGESRPKRVRDRCPDCGGAVEWVDEYATDGEREWWTGAAAECDCGLEMHWNPDRTDRIEARRREAIARYDDEQEAGQLRLIG